MKLARKNITSAVEALEFVPYNVVKDTSLIVIPIETEKTCEFDGIELNVKNTEMGVKRPAEPVLVLGRNSVTLGYADTMYAKRFDLFDYLELIGRSDLDRFEVLSGVEVLLIDKTNLFLSFELF